MYEEAQGAKVDGGDNVQHTGVHAIHGDEKYGVGDALDTFCEIAASESMKRGPYKGTT